MFSTEAKKFVAALQGQVEQLEAENKYGMSDVYELHKQVEARMEKQMAEQVKEKEDALKMIQRLEKENAELRAAARRAAREVSDLEATVKTAAFQLDDLRYTLDEAEYQVEKRDEVIDTMEEQLLHKEAQMEVRDLKIRTQEAQIGTLKRSLEVLMRETARGNQMMKDLHQKNKELERTKYCTYTNTKIYVRTKEQMREICEREGFPPPSSSSSEAEYRSITEQIVEGESESEDSDSLSRSLSLDSTQFGSVPSTEFSDEEEADE